MEKKCATLSGEEKRIINLLQKDFGFEVEPFKSLAQKLEMSEAHLMMKLQELKERGFITRVGPFFNLDKSNGYVSLVAMSVPEEKFEDVANIVNSYEEVAHNYKRAHAYNMWFVLACSAVDEAMLVLDKIEKETGYPVMNLPKLQEFSLDLYLEVQ